jgi:uncharacterized OB-fold protein
MPITGTVFSFTEVHAPPSGFEYEAPYPLAIVELENGVKILAQIIDTQIEKIHIGSKVQMRFRRVGDDDEEAAISYGYKFALVEDSAPSKPSEPTASKG